MSKIFITGAAGYVGGHLVDTLLKSGHQVTAYDNLTFEDFYNKKGVNFILGDVRDYKRMAASWVGHKVLIHLAAHVGDGACTVNPAASLSINREVVRFISEEFRGHIIYPSTCSVYGAQHGILSEETPAKPLSLYGSSKYESEKFLLERPRKSTILRLGTLFGVSDEVSRPRLDLVINVMTLRAFSGEKIKVFGGDQFRPVLHVKDVGECMAMLASKLDLYGDTGIYSGVFNLSSQNVRILDLAHQVRCHFPDIEIESTELPFEDLRNYRVDNSKMKTVLEFTPKYSIDYGICELKKLLPTIVNPRNSKYHNHNFFKENPSVTSYLGEDLSKLELELNGKTISSL